MKRSTGITAVLIAITVVASLAAQRAAGTDFNPAAAHQPTPIIEQSGTQGASGDGLATDALIVSPARARGHAAAESTPVAEATEAPAVVRRAMGLPQA